MELQDESQDRITLADLVPVALSEPIAARLRMSGEYRLLWAVLEDGIVCYLRSGDHPAAAKRKLFQETNDWIEVKEGESLCSFSSICGVFQLDPDYLRRRLRDLREHQTRGPLKQAA